VLPFNRDKGLIIVPVRLQGATGDIVVRFALDTGATGSSVNWDIAKLLGYDPDNITERTQLITASGVERAPAIVLQRIEALGQEHSKFSVLCHSLPADAGIDGILGLDFFRNSRLVLDFRLGLVSLD
jgi:predicted aspartyl protease